MDIYFDTVTVHCNHIKVYTHTEAIVWFNKSEEPNFH